MTTRILSRFSVETDRNIQGALLYDNAEEVPTDASYTVAFQIKTEQVRINLAEARALWQLLGSFIESAEKRTTG